MNRPGMDALLQSRVGTPFKHLPGAPPSHKILGTCSDGNKIRADMVEMVMNDAWLIDTVHGAGHYASLDTGKVDIVSVRTREVYTLAVKLYGCEPVNLHEGERAGC